MHVFVVAICFCVVIAGIAAAEKLSFSARSAAACPAMTPQQCAAQMATAKDCRWCPVGPTSGHGQCVPYSRKCVCEKIFRPDDCTARNIFSNCQWCSGGGGGGSANQTAAGYCQTGGKPCECSRFSRDACELSEQCKPCPVGATGWKCVPSTTICECSVIPSLNSCVAAGTRSGGHCSWCPVEGGPADGECGESSRICDCTKMSMSQCAAYPYCQFCPGNPTGRCQHLTGQC